MSMLLRRMWILPIRLYQKTLSRFLGNHCRFQPSCSVYACEAIMRKGILRGTLLAAWRVLRCNPFCEGGYDPVPGEAPQTGSAPADGGIQGGHGGSEACGNGAGVRA